MMSQVRWIPFSYILQVNKLLCAFSLKPVYVCLRLITCSSIPDFHRRKISSPRFYLLCSLSCPWYHSIQKKKNVAMNIPTTFAFCWQSYNITLMNAPHSLVFVAVDFIAAMLIRSTGHTLQMARNRSLKSLDLTKSVNDSGESY